MRGKYPSQWLEELRSRTDIVKLINNYVPLKKNGTRYLGLCPFHNEKTPSFNVDEQKQLYYCFGCKAGGSVFQFIMEMEHLTFNETVEHLAKQNHMALPSQTNTEEEIKQRSEKERLYLVNKTAAKLFHELLWQPSGIEILNYLKKRGLSDSLIRRFGLGAAPSNIKIEKELLQAGFSQEELIASGLIRKKENSTFDMFRSRAIFPIIDAYGNVLGFGGRSMGEQQPKYLNTSDTLVFNKRLTVYGINRLRKLRNLSRVLLVEGYMDVVSLSQYGIEGAVATLGTALTPQQAKLISRYSNDIHFAYDGDSAGQKAILRGLDVFENEGISVHVLDLPNNMDPDEFIRTKGIEAFLALKPYTAIAYKMLREKEKYNLSTDDGRSNYATACAKLLQKVTQPIELENYVRQLALETGYEKEIIHQQIGVNFKTSKPTYINNRVSKIKSTKQSNEHLAQCTLLAALATGNLPTDAIDINLFTNPQLKSIAQSIIKGDSLASILDQQPDESCRELVVQILNIEIQDNVTNLQTMAQECVHSITVSRIEQELNNILENLPKLNPSEQQNELARAETLNKQLRTLL